MGGRRWLPLPLTLGVLRGDEGLDERVGGLRVERQSVAEGGQLSALLQEGLLQAVSTRVKILLRQKDAESGPKRPPAPTKIPKLVLFFHLCFQG